MQAILCRMDFLGKISHVLASEPVAVIAGLLALATTVVTWGLLSAFDYLAAIDTHTLIMLFCLMFVVAGLREEGVLHWTACNLIVRARDAQVLSFILIGCCFFGSMVVTNDVSLMVFVPLAYVSLRLANCSSHFLRTVVLQTVAANLGSSLSPIGNPQNIYLQSHYGIGLDSFALVMGPIVIAGAAGIAAMALAALPARPMNAVDLGQRQALSRKRVGVLLTLLALCIACVAGLFPSWVLLLLVLACGLIGFRMLFLQVDYALLLTFVFFFILVANLQHIEAVHALISSLTAASPFAASVAASQVISNVPAAVLLSGFTPDGLALLAGTNVGGLGTLIASLASLISFKLFTQLTSAKGKRIWRYMLFFTIANVILLAMLCGLQVCIG